MKIAEVSIIVLNFKGDRIEAGSETSRQALMNFGLIEK